MKFEEKSLPIKIRRLFYFLVFNFLLLILIMFTSLVENVFVGSELFLLPFVTFCVGGFLLVYWTKKFKLKGEVKKRMNIVGYSAGLIFVSVFLHNVLSAVGIYLTGDRSFEEPVFFIFATIALPVIFVFGVAGVFILLKNN